MQLLVHLDFVVLHRAIFVLSLFEILLGCCQGLLTAIVPLLQAERILH